MEAATETGKSKRTRGRKDADKQEAVTKPNVVGERIEELVRLHTKAKEAATDESEAIKKCAEDSGYNATNIRSLVVARAGESFQEKKKNIEQQMELFDEVGE